MSKEPIPGKRMACGYLLNEVTKNYLYNLAAAEPDFDPTARNPIFSEIDYVLSMIVGYRFGKPSAYPLVVHKKKKYSCFALATTDPSDPLPCTPKPETQERVAKHLLRKNPPLWFPIIDD